MVTLNLPSGKYKLPKRLTIEQWMDCMQLDLQDPIFWSVALSKVTGAPLTELRDCPQEGLELGMGFLISLLGQQKRPLEFLPLDSIRFGEWVDLDVWAVWGPDKHMTDMMSILAPKVQYADEALWVFTHYSKWRLSVYKSYRALFGLDDPQGDEREPKDKLAIARGWYSLIVKLANGNILNIDPVTEQPLKKALNLLAYQKQVELEERAAAMQIKRKYDIQRPRR